MRFYLFFVLLLMAPMQAHSFYKCTNESGGITYQKIPCKHSSVQSKLHVYVAPKPGIAAGSEFSDDNPDASEEASSIRDNLGAIMSSLTPVKLAAVEFRQSSGEWPKALSDVGMNEKEMTSSYVDGVKLDGSGKITARLNRDFGKNKKLILEPYSVMSGTSFEWKCYTNFPKESLPSGREMMCESRIIN